MSTTGDTPPTGFVSRLLLKAFGPAQITPSDDDDRQAQKDYQPGPEVPGHEPR